MIMQLANMLVLGLCLTSRGFKKAQGMIVTCGFCDTQGACTKFEEPLASV